MTGDGVGPEGHRPQRLVLTRCRPEQLQQEWPSVHRPALKAAVERWQTWYLNMR
jgi:hypothetical protein